MEIRTATETDVPVLAAIYLSAVRSLGPLRYSDPQVESWAMFPADEAAFRAFILGPTTYVAMDGGQAVGFGGISGDGHVTALYVRGDRPREGIGSALLLRLLEHARRHSIQQLRSEASYFSRPLFAKHGFDDAGTDVVVRDGVEFVRFLVTKML